MVNLSPSRNDRAIKLKPVVVFEVFGEMWNRQPQILLFLESNQFFFFLILGEERITSAECSF